ncbi:hypothetical protein [Thermoleptolyngbya sp.]
MDQRSAALDAKLDRIAVTLESQNRALEGHIQLAQQQAQTVATLTTLVCQAQDYARSLYFVGRSRIHKFELWMRQKNLLSK